MSFRLILSVLLVLLSLRMSECVFAKNIYCVNIPNESNEEIPKSVELFNLIEKYTSEYDVPKKIAYNISYKETRYKGPNHVSYNPHRSNGGAHGPMQITVLTSNHINKEKIGKNKLKNDLDYNVKTSMKLLSRLYNKYGSWDKACGAYNTGKPIINSYARFCVNNDYKTNWINE